MTTAHPAPSTTERDHGTGAKDTGLATVGRRLEDAEGLDGAISSLGL